MEGFGFTYTMKDGHLHIDCDLTKQGRLGKTNRGNRDFELVCGTEGYNPVTLPETGVRLKLSVLRDPTKGSTLIGTKDPTKMTKEQLLRHFGVIKEPEVIAVEDLLKMSQEQLEEYLSSKSKGEEKASA